MSAHELPSSEQDCNCRGVDRDDGLHEANCISQTTKQNLKDAGSRPDELGEHARAPERLPKAGAHPSSKTVTEVINVMTERFTFGNSIPVERAYIKRNEWDTLVSELTRQVEKPDSPTGRIVQPVPAKATLGRPEAGGAVRASDETTPPQSGT